MSIIHHALKKTQNQLKEKINPQQPDPNKKPVSPKPGGTYSPSSISPQAQSSFNRPDHPQPLTSSGGRPPHPKVPSGKKKNEKTLIVFITVVLIITGFLSAVFFYLINQSSSTPRFNQWFQRPHSVKNYKNMLVLNGTLMQNDHLIAMINDEIYEVGDSVNGKKIIDIKLNRVDLLDGEKIVTLSIPHKKK